MYFMSWLRDILTSLGLLNKHAKILFLGLDNSGKTTLLRRIKSNEELGPETPTKTPNVLQLRVGNVVFTNFDLSGALQLRRVWKEYLNEVTAIIFMVDSSDRGRFLEARVELNRLLFLEEIKNVPFLVLGTKIDNANSVSETTLREALCIETTGKDTVPHLCSKRPIELFLCSVKEKRGLTEGFIWLRQYV